MYFPSTIEIKNESTGYTENKLIDIIIYHTHNSNGFRMLFFLPLIPKQLGLNFSDAKINISHIGFGKIAKELFENDNTKIELNKIYCT